MKRGNDAGSGARPRVPAKGRRAPAPPRAREDGPPAGEERERLIAEVAYFRAQARGFAPGRELEDWLQAEAEIDRLLRGTEPLSSAR